MMPRDKIIFAVQGAIIAYVLYQVGSTVYNHLKAKDRLKRNYKYFRILSIFFLVYFSHQITLQRQCRLIRFPYALSKKNIYFFT